MRGYIKIKIIITVATGKPMLFFNFITKFTKQIEFSSVFQVFEKSKAEIQ